MIWKMLGATAAVGIIVIGYLVLSVPITAVFNSLNAIFPNVSLNGVSMSNFTHNQFELWGAAIVLTLLCVAAFLFASAHADENDTGFIT